VKQLRSYLKAYQEKKVEINKEEEQRDKKKLLNR